MKFQDDVQEPRSFRRPSPIVYFMFHSEDICHKVSKTSQNDQMYNVFDPNFWEGQSYFKPFVDQSS